MELEEALEQAEVQEEEEELFVIDNELRTITIPSNIQNVGVESDEDVRRLRFQMPKQYGEVDLSAFDVRVNYLNANKEGDVYVVTDKEVSGDHMTFSWLLSRNAMAYKGTIRFIVCLKKTDDEGVTQQEFNTTIAQLTVLEGLETTEKMIQENKDLIEAILKQLEDAIQSTVEQFYLSTSPTTLSGGSWSTTQPTWTQGKYIWRRTLVTKADGTTSYTPSVNGVCITGNTGATGATGATGTGIASITEEYYLSTSKTTQSGGSWTTTPPAWSNGKYIWTRSKIVYKNPTSTVYTTPVCDSSWEAANGAAKVATNYMDFTTSGGLQIGNKTSGSWSGFRTQITSSAFNILNAAGAVLASCGASLIELGKNSINAIIKLCGGKGQISYDSSDGYLKVSSDKIQLLGSGDSSIITKQTIGGVNYETIVSTGNISYDSELGYFPEIQIEVKKSNSTNGIYINPDRMNLTTNAFLALSAGEITLDGRTTIQDALDVYGVGIIGCNRIFNGWLGFYHNSTDAMNNTNRIGYIGPPDTSSVDIHIKNEAGGWTYVTSTFRCLESIRTASGLYLEAPKSTATGVICYWKDGELHDIIARASDGLTLYLGPRSISSSYKTVTNLRGYTVRLYNYGGGTYLGASGSTAVTSDRNLKRDIYDINDQYVEFFMRLRPVSYKYNAKENVGHRDHIGYIAQEVEDALLDSGLTTEQFGGICIETDVDFNMDYDSEMTEEELAAGNIHYDKLYSLRYEEFIALNTHMIQKALNLIDAQQTKIDELETRIAKLEKILERHVSE